MPREYQRNYLGTPTLDRSRANIEPTENPDDPNGRHPRTRGRSRTSGKGKQYWHQGRGCGETDIEFFESETAGITSAQNQIATGDTEQKSHDTSAMNDESARPPIHPSAEEESSTY
jgi:hypothetical protein